MAETFEATSRYGTSLPDPQTVCTGPCEGMGCFPLYNPDLDKRTGNVLRPAKPESLNGTLLALWMTSHEYRGPHICDGYHFVTCPDCGGTGKRTGV